MDGGQVTPVYGKDSGAGVLEGSVFRGMRWEAFFQDLT